MKRIEIIDVGNLPNVLEATPFLQLIDILTDSMLSWPLRATNEEPENTGIGSQVNIRRLTELFTI